MRCYIFIFLIACSPSFHERQTSLATSIRSAPCKTSGECALYALQANNMLSECSEAHKPGAFGVDWHQSYNCSISSDSVGDAEYRVYEFKSSRQNYICYKKNNGDACYALHTWALSALNIKSDLVREDRLLTDAFNYCNHACSVVGYNKCCAYIKDVGDRAASFRQDKSRNMNQYLCTEQCEDFSVGCKILSSTVVERDYCTARTSTCIAACKGVAQ